MRAKKQLFLNPTIHTRISFFEDDGAGIAEGADIRQSRGIYLPTG
jgi:hypothetical protein